jgi:hypothetical protein
VVVRGDGVAVRQEDVVHHEAGVVAEEALEVTVVAVALALEVVEAQEGSAVAVAVVEDLEVVVVFEDHDTVFMHMKHEFPNGLRLVGGGERTRNGHLKMGYDFDVFKSSELQHCVLGLHRLG